MTKSPIIDKNGKPRQDVEFVVLDRYGTIEETVSLHEMQNLKEFSKKVEILTETYGMVDCYKYQTFDEAKRILDQENNKYDRKIV